MKAAEITRIILTEPSTRSRAQLHPQLCSSPGASQRWKWEPKGLLAELMKAWKSSQLTPAPRLSLPGGEGDVLRITAHFLLPTAATGGSDILRLLPELAGDIVGCISWDTTGAPAHCCSSPETPGSCWVPCWLPRDWGKIGSLQGKVNLV